MVAVQLQTDIGRRHLCVFLGKHHHQLARIGYLTLSRLAIEQILVNAELRAYSVDNHIKRHLTAAHLD